MRCAVVGGGAWGTALADMLATSGHDVRLWALEADVIRSVNATHQNPVFLPGFTLAPALVAAGDHSAVLSGAEFVIYATPSQHLREIARAGQAHVATDAVCAVASKGIEAGTLALMSDVVADELKGREVVAVSGPTFAAEVAARMPTAIVAASTSHAAARITQDVMSNATFRVYTHDDVIGVELGGALKNVMAVATGIVEGVGLGYNSRAALITRGIAEMTRLGVALGARGSTFAGLAGIGDLVLTCTGALSRNHQVGIELAKGRKLAEIIGSMRTVAEGVKTTRATVALAARHGVEMPITRQVHRILEGEVSPRDAIRELMERSLKDE